MKFTLYALLCLVIGCNHQKQNQQKSSSVYHVYYTHQNYGTNYIYSLGYTGQNVDWIILHNSRVLYHNTTIQNVLIKNNTKEQDIVVWDHNITTPLCQNSMQIYDFDMNKHGVLKRNYTFDECKDIFNRLGATASINDFEVEIYE